MLKPQSALQSPLLQAMPSDRSFHFGDGLFTTALVRNSKIEMRDAHLARMREGMQRLGFGDVDLDRVFTELDNHASGLAKNVIKCVVSRGQGGRGYGTRQVTAPQAYFQVSEYPAHYAIWQQEGVELGIANQRLGINPTLAGIKHSNRLEQVLIRTELDNRGLAEAVVLDYQGWVIEGCSCNLFWFKDGVWYTPQLDQAGVAGVMRQRIINVLHEKGCAVEIGRYTLSELQAAQSVFICNALMQVVPVTRIDQQRFSIQAVQDVMSLL